MGNAMRKLAITSRRELSVVMDGLERVCDEVDT